MSAPAATAKFGIEAEYALIRPDGRFADCTNTAFAEVQPFIDRLPDYGHPELRVGDAGIRVKNWYVEGDERFDDHGRSTGMTFKGIEIRTAVFASIAQATVSLAELRAMLKAQLQEKGWSLAAIGFNPCTASYDPAYTDWERQLHASHVGHRLPQVSTLSFGPDLNFTCPGHSASDAIETARRLTYYSPYIVPFSFGSPFVGGRLWEGLSYRTFRRTGPRPAALAHLATPSDHPLAKEADPPSQHLRVEFKAFDMVRDDRLLAELFHLVFGIALADPRALPGGADVPDAQLHRRVALTGFEDDEIHEGVRMVVGAAKESLRANGYDARLALLEAMLAARRTPAHAMRERFGETGTFPIAC